MKIRKALYILAGVFNCIVGSFAAILGLFMLLFSSMVKKMFASSGQLIDEFVTEMAEMSEKYQYLATASDDEVLSFIMKIVYICALVFLLFAAVWITMGAFNLVLRKKHEVVLENKKHLKIIFVVASWVLLFFNVANILTTIAVFMKVKKDDNKNQFYSADSING